MSDTPTTAEQADTPESQQPNTPQAETAPDEAATVSPGAATPAGVQAETAERPSARIKLGSAREPSGAAKADKPAPKPVNPVATKSPPPKPTNYPPPNVRAQLSPEQEAELEAAMAGESMDALIDSAAAAPPAEIAPDTRTTGRVASISDDYLMVDLGAHRQGTLPLKQFDQGADKPTLDIPEVGGEIAVAVVRLNTDEGLYELSLPTAAIEIGDWDEITEGQIVEVTVTGVNKGGLDCQVAGIRGFMPMGQISLYRVEQPEDYVGQKLSAVITEAKRSRQNLVLSHRAVMERERAENREKLLTELAPGQVREGTVRSLKDFGAFVDLGGVDGLIHVSQMSWDRVNHPSEVLAEGQAVKVKIEKIDPETGKIGLSYRESATNPWDDADAKYPIGGTVKGQVSKLMDFGAFVKLEPGVEGLIHISELEHCRVVRVSDVVSEGQDVETKVLSVDRQKQRIGLSLRALQAAPAKPGKETNEEAEFVPPADAPKAPKKHQGNLKGGISGPSGGEQFGLNW